MTQTFPDESAEPPEFSLSRKAVIKTVVSAAAAAAVAVAAASGVADAAVADGHVDDATVVGPVQGGPGDPPVQQGRKVAGDQATEVPVFVCPDSS